MGNGAAKQEPTDSVSEGSDIARSNSTESLEGGSEEYADPKFADSEEYFDIICVPCHRDEATVEAFGYCCQCKEHLCRFCYKYHKKARPCRHHKLLDKNAMPSTQRLDRSDRNRQQNQDQASTSTTPTSDNSEQSASTTTPTQHKERQYQGGKPSTTYKQQQGQSETSTKTTLHQEQANAQTQPNNHQKAKTSPEPIPVSTTVYDNITPKYQGEICVKTSSDLMSCYITGLTMISPGKLVLCDKFNNSIKLVDVCNKSVISKLSIRGAPWDIKSTSNSQVAVTVPSKPQIQFINVTDKLTLSNSFATSDINCYGIGCYKDKLLVTYFSSSKLELITMDGKVISCVEKDSTGADVFSKPEYVQANSSSIFVTECEKEQVIMLNWQGEVTGRIGDLCRPRGLAPLHDGSLLVCDWGCNGMVYHVSGDGTNKRAVLEDVRYPEAICVDEEGHKLYISRWMYDDDEINNNILVYQI